MSQERFSTAELMIAAMAREIEDGDCLAQGIGTSLPACAYYLAQLTHAPSCVFLYSVGGTFSATRAPLSLTRMEDVALRDPIRRVSYTEIVCAQLPGLRFKEFSRPAQVDCFGNTNNIMVTSPSGKLLRLPGAGGIPDFSGYDSHDSYLYLPRQDRLSLVEKLEFCSGVGAEAGLTRPFNSLERSGVGTRRLITDLGVIEFSRHGAGLISLHPGVSFEQAQSRSSFALRRLGTVPETSAPTDEQLHLIRNVIDPNSIRELELLPSRQRLGRIRRIIELESAQRQGAFA